MKKILIIEDNHEMALELIKFFNKYKYQVSHFDDIFSAQTKSDIKEFGSFIIDINLPQISGLKFPEILKNLKKTVPVIAISGSVNPQTKIEALKVGFSDYVEKPLNLEELRLRLEAQYRLINQGDSQSSDLQIIEVNDFKIDTRNYQIFYCGKKIKLTKVEYKILDYMVRHSDMLIEKSRLIEEIWGEMTDLSKVPIRMHISNIRNKLKDKSYKIIQTVPAWGYKLNSKMEK